MQTVDLADFGGLAVTILTDRETFLPENSLQGC